VQDRLRESRIVQQRSDARVVDRNAGPDGFGCSGLS
jgi:hypothetical protein